MSYTTDYFEWTQETARAIEAGRFEEIDRVALADEVRDLGKSERARIESSLRLLLAHALKLQYQPEKETRSWHHTIEVQRLHLKRYLKDSPSLRARLGELIADAYEIARYDAEAETGLNIDTFPETCPWTPEQLLHGQ